MAILLLVAILLLIGLVMGIRHSRGFRGSGEHFAAEMEGQPPELKLSKGLPRNDSGGSLH